MDDTVKLIREAKGFLIDWDGCCAIDDRILPSAGQFLRATRTRVAIVSNNSTHTISDFLRLLRRDGAPLRGSQLVLAGVEALNLAWESGARKIMVLGQTRMSALARRKGFALLKDQTADTVVLMRDTKFTYPKLERAANALARGARLIVANPDATHPGANGRIVPETGALLAALSACVDLNAVDMRVVGKPSAHMFLKASAAVDAPMRDLVMIGDNPKTDLAGAQALGIQAVMVGASPGAFFARALEALRTA